MAKSKQGNIVPQKGKALPSRPKGLITHNNSAEALQKQITVEDQYLADGDNEMEVIGVHARHHNRNTDKNLERGKKANVTRTKKRRVKREELTTRSNPVQVIDHLTREMVAELADLKGEGYVSIYLPTSMKPHDVNEDVDLIAFKGALQQITPELQEQTNKAAAILKPGMDLVKNEAFWKNLTPGLAVFLSPEVSRIVKLPFAPKPYSVVNSTFHLMPLVPLLTDREYFYLLIISKKKASLYSCDHYNIRHIDIKEMPDGIEDVVHLEEKDDQKLFRTGSSGAGGGASYHGMGAGKPDEKENISMYLKEVDRTLWSEVLNTETAPLVVGGVEYLVTIFKGLTQYNNVWQPSLTGNLEYENVQVLFEEAKRVVRPYFEEKTRKALAAYGNQSATNLVSMRPVDIIPAAFYSRVARLFVEDKAELWGKFDEENSSIIIHKERERGDENLVDKAVLKTLLNGGEVHFLSATDMPAHGPMAALMRY